jgi:alpha/beta superfamily hydrolase
VIPGADHFFHRKLHIIRRIIEHAFAGPQGERAPAAPGEPA